MTSADYYRLGNDFRRQGDFKRAMEAYMEAIALDPESPAAEAKKIYQKHYGKNSWCHRGK